MVVAVHPDLGRDDVQFLDQVLAEFGHAIAAPAHPLPFRQAVEDVFPGKVGRKGLAAPGLSLLGIALDFGLGCRSRGVFQLVKQQRPLRLELFGGLAPHPVDGQHEFSGQMGILCLKFGDTPVLGLIILTENPDFLFQG